jgi:hypothetical protein
MSPESGFTINAKSRVPILFTKSLLFNTHTYSLRISTYLNDTITMHTNREVQLVNHGGYPLISVSTAGVLAISRKTGTSSLLHPLHRGEISSVILVTSVYLKSVNVSSVMDGNPLMSEDFVRRKQQGSAY